MDSRDCEYVQAVVDELAAALCDMLRAFESLIPGVKYIAVQDYALLNEAPMAAHAALKKWGVE
jgi:hypothetical protein